MRGTEQSGAPDAKGWARFVMRESRDPSVESRGPSMKLAAQGCQRRFFFSNAFSSQQVQSCIEQRVMGLGFVVTGR